MEVPVLMKTSPTTVNVIALTRVIIVKKTEMTATRCRVRMEVVAMTTLISE